MYIVYISFCVRVRVCNSQETLYVNYVKCNV